MERSRETALPMMNDWLSESEISEVRTKYEEFRSKFIGIWDKNEIIAYLQDPKNETLYDL
jgi:hypothetical protein